MAETFNNVKSRNIGVTPTNVGGYTAPVATQVTIIGLTVSNVTTLPVKCSISIYDGANDFFILKNADVAVGQAHSVIGGDQKVVLNVGESIRVVSDMASSLDAVMSKLELT